MSCPELPKIRERRQDMHNSRKYFLKASEVYAVLRTQRGYQAIAPCRFRAALRRVLYGSQFTLGTMYLSRPGKHHLPERDIVLNWGHNAYDGRHTKDGSKYLTRYSYQDIGFIAGELPFCCPMCGGSENPLQSLEYDLPVYWQEEQLICLKCWQRWTDFCQHTPIKLIEIDDLIKQLNREINNVTKERRERRRAAEKLGGSIAERDVRHTGSEAISDPCIQ